jgi:hypothetical protein
MWDPSDYQCKKIDATHLNVKCRNISGAVPVGTSDDSVAVKVNTPPSTCQQYFKILNNDIKHTADIHTHY